MGVQFVTAFEQSVLTSAIKSKMVAVSMETKRGKIIIYFVFSS